MLHLQHSIGSKLWDIFFTALLNCSGYRFIVGIAPSNSLDLL